MTCTHPRWYFTEQGIKCPYSNCGKLIAKIGTVEFYALMRRWKK